MPLLERGYQAAAKTELERRVREIEHRDEVSQKKADIEESAAVVTTNIDFAQRIKLISGQDAERYRQRIKAALMADELIRTQTGDRVDGYMNPHEQGLNRYSLEEVQAKISREQAEAAAQRTQETSRAKDDALERKKPY